MILILLGILLAGDPPPLLLGRVIVDFGNSDSPVTDVLVPVLLALGTSAVQGVLLGDSREFPKPRHKITWAISCASLWMAAIAYSLPLFVASASPLRADSPWMLIVLAVALLPMSILTGFCRDIYTGAYCLLLVVFFAYLLGALGMGWGEWFTALGVFIPIGILCWKFPKGALSALYFLLYAAAAGGAFVFAMYLLDYAIGHDIEMFSPLGLALLFVIVALLAVVVFGGPGTLLAIVAYPIVLTYSLMASLLSRRSESNANENPKRER